MTPPEPALDGLFGGDHEMLVVPILGDAWESAERAVSAELVAAHALRLSELLALDRIHRAGRTGIRTNALARALRIPSNRLTYQLSGLQERAYIVRRPHPDDGRGVVLTLTDAGREAHRKALATYRRLARRRLRALGEGQEGDRLAAAAAILSGRVPDSDVARIVAKDGTTG